MGNRLVFVSATLKAHGDGGPWAGRGYKERDLPEESAKVVARRGSHAPTALLMGPGRKLGLGSGGILQNRIDQVVMSTGTSWYRFCG